MKTAEHKATDELFHALWGKAKDAPNYDKDEWMRLQALIAKTQAAADPPCDRCDERDQHRFEADEGMRTAAEISGFL